MSSTSKILNLPRGAEIKAPAADMALQKFLAYHGYFVYRQTQLKLMLRRDMPPGIRFFNPDTLLPYPEPPCPKSIAKVRVTDAAPAHSF